MKHQPSTKEFVDEVFGHERVYNVGISEVTISGPNWEVSYHDDPMRHEYASTFRDHVTAAALTVWFTDPMKRKDFMSTIKTDDGVDQTTTGMYFSNLDGKPRIYPWELKNISKFMKRLAKILFVLETAKDTVRRIN